MSCIGCQAKDAEIARLVAQNENLLRTLLEMGARRTQEPVHAAQVNDPTKNPNMPPPTVWQDEKGQEWVTMDGKKVSKADYDALMKGALVIDGYGVIPEDEVTRVNDYLARQYG